VPTVAGLSIGVGSSPVVLLVRYGELALKSAYVRRALEDRLAANVRTMFAVNGVECVVKVERGRLFVHAEDEAAALRLLGRVFGIVSISPANEGKSDLEALTSHVVDYARGVLATGDSFAIRARRSGQHPYTSQELARVLGRAIQDAILGLAVDLDAPDLAIHVEVRGPRAYVFHEVVEGPGGLPLGSQGDVSAVAGDEDGMVAVWLLMRRGCRVRVAGPDTVVAPLQKWDPSLERDTFEATAGGGVPLPGPTAAYVNDRGENSLTLAPLGGLPRARILALAQRIRNA